MPAPSPPGLNSSIEYFAMSVGIGQNWHFICLMPSQTVPIENC
jgi:hypothetical protein